MTDALTAAIARAAALPCWTGPVDPEPLTGGITNLNFRVEDAGRSFVVRLGEDIPVHGVMRFNELAISRAANAAGISPGVHFHAPGALVLDFIPSRALTEEEVRAPEMLPRVLDLLARVHSDVAPHLRGPVLTFWVFHVIRDYAATLRADGSPHAAALPGLLTQAERLEAAVGPVDIVLGHNDLLAANILDDGTRLWLIDWEYGGFNSPLFDLGGLATNNGLSEAQELAILESYFRADPAARWRPYQAMKCASLMRETLWSMVSETHSEIDFDYAAYTAENLSRLRLALADFENS